jgi:diguanylate cyclase (GGDEF)-like protein
MLNALSHPFEVDGLQLQISASIGIGLFPDHGADDVSLMKSADNAMYRAKDVGRACLVFAS